MPPNEISDRTELRGDFYSDPIPELSAILTRYRDHPGVEALHDRFSQQSCDPPALRALAADCMRVLEDILPARSYADDAVADYQHVCRLGESLALNDDRHRFLVVIPTADRPRQLRECLASLLELCRIYAYGGCVDGRYPLVSVMIADDSRHAASIHEHQALAQHFEAAGLPTLYFGLDEQIAELERVPAAMRARLCNVFGQPDTGAFYHKGHSVMRNILYLHLRRLAAADQRLLFYFADSDQEFRIKIGDERGDRDVYALNYFYHLDRVFRERDIEMLTGKVVGDPPVSPAVMAGNFLDDVRAFLLRAAALEPDASCPFHDRARSQDDGAAYHDMAGLFGFTAAAQVHEYRCGLRGQHTIAACVDDFSAKLAHFFDGEHPTRITYYEAADHDGADPLHRDGIALRPARTVYTGNYVIRADALRHFVPFAPLRLRMSGPTFGRLLQQQLGPRFVSANLPMLHKRTEAESGASEFRPGVVRDAQRVDLSNEFERQFFGDVMLFSIEKLTVQGFPAQPVTERAISDTLEETAGQMERLYRDRQAQIVRKLAELRSLRDELGRRFAAVDDAWTRLDTFLDNITHNFGPDAAVHRLITDSGHRQRRHAQLLAAIAAYRDDRLAWETALTTHASASSALKATLG